MGRAARAEQEGGLAVKPLGARGLAVVGVIACTWAGTADAQYFGRNPVQWERLKFEVLKTEHFDIHFYPEEKEAAEVVGRLAERWYARLSRILRHEFEERQPLVLYASHPHFQQTNTIGGPPGEGTGGVTEAFKRRIVLPVGGSLAETDHVLGHELVHAFQYAMTGQGRVSSTNYPSALRMPLWFIEGMAEYLSVGPVDAHTAMWLRDAARKEKLPRIRDLGNPKYFPYRYGQALWAYIAGRFGDKAIGAALRATNQRTNDAEAVLKQVLGIDHESLSKDWHAAIRDAVAPVMAGKQGPGAYGPALVTEKGEGGRLNLGPALSPDGSQLAFLSERDLFSIELFLADAKTGEIERRLSRTVVDPHLESIQFINSAGSWDKAGRRLALGAISKGRPLLAVLDAKSGDRMDEVPLPTLGEIYTPSFAPDGKRVVFSALVNGFTDLFVYDLERKSLERLTEDAFADLQPAWSPDGRTIAFVTDRFSTQLATLDAGNYRLAAIDAESGDVRALSCFEEGKNINPQWAADSQSLFFLSDTSGITNLYRLDLETSELRQLTDLLTGISGITALSPALSAAAGSEKLAFSVYAEDKYEIYAISDAGRLAGAPIALGATPAAALIPGARPSGDVLAAREDAQTGLAEPASFREAPYEAKLGLDYVGQPYVAAGVDRYGAAFGGGISMSFSDMLGEHSLDTVLNANSISGFTDLGAIASYVNRVNRFNWGAYVAQVPYVTGGFASGVAIVDGQPVFVEQALIERQLERRVAALGFHPFNASLRLELQAGYRNISFDRRLETNSFSLVTGELLSSGREDLPAAAGFNLFEGGVALVGDTSVFGATSPILGQRFRLDVAPVGGTVRYVGALADYRRYVMPVRPLTLAARVMHYGRYGSGGEDPRFAPLFIGYQSLVRGYDTDSFSATECGARAGECPVYEQLLGSRLLVANLEARLPLLALFGAKNLYGPIPIEVGAFFDAGVAWDSNSKPTFFGGDRELVKSVGATARVNIFGFAVLQVDYAKPLDRPGKSPFFQFNLLSGF
jgi:Tol biopolymer transport system component